MSPQRIRRAAWHLRYIGRDLRRNHTHPPKHEWDGEYPDAQESSEEMLALADDLYALAKAMKGSARYEVERALARNKKP